MVMSTMYYILRNHKTSQVELTILQFSVLTNSDWRANRKSF
jgi:hypothetical protein